MTGEYPHLLTCDQLFLEEFQCIRSTHTAAFEENTYDDIILKRCMLNRSGDGTRYEAKLESDSALPPVSMTARAPAVGKKKGSEATSFLFGKLPEIDMEKIATDSAKHNISI